MTAFSRLIRFESDGKIYFSDLGVDTLEPPSPGTSVKAFISLDDLAARKNEATVTLDKAGIPRLTPCSRPNLKLTSYSIIASGTGTSRRYTDLLCWNEFQVPCSRGQSTYGLVSDTNPKD
jgi:hypothetical protein